MVKVPSVPMSSGRHLPLLGLGTWLANNEAELDAAVRAALDCGYRYIDTAFVYKNEHVIGAVVKEYIDAGKFKREDIFITTKLPMYGHAHAAEYIQKSLKNLQTDYVDLYLIHIPIPFQREEGNDAPKAVDGVFVPDLSVPYIETWKVLEKHYNEGKLKAIGVSNFNEEQLQDLYNKATVKPHNIQVETHILHPQKRLFALAKKLKMTFTAYSPMGSPGRLASPLIAGGDIDIAPLKEPLVLRLAQKYNKTTAQILIRQTIQRGMSAIPKSTNPTRVRENFDVLNFELTAADMAEFDKITVNERIFLFDFAKNHPWHPWKSDLRRRLGINVDAATGNTINGHTKSTCRCTRKR
uniref:Aldo_ket_red domain-containing protein n=1 Tax=Panagrellus redivivus TaxID=6233 RepID=A0A7E4VUD6_PANRE